MSNIDDLGSIKKTIIENKFQQEALNNILKLIKKNESLVFDLKQYTNEFNKKNDLFDLMQIFTNKGYIISNSGRYEVNQKVFFNLFVKKRRLNS
jgi:hypothetical protein